MHPTHRRAVAATLATLFLLAVCAAADEKAAEPADAESTAGPTASGLLADDAPVEFVLSPEREALLWQVRPGAIPVGESPFTWSALHYSLQNGPHDLTITSNMAYYEDNWGFGTGLPTGSMGGSITYRYRGLFNGIVRPLIRVSVHGSQGWDTAGMSNAGLAQMWTGYAFAEAGLEIVYRGYGVGMTAGYVLPMYAVFPSEGDKYTTGPWSPDYENFNWGQLVGNAFLVIE